MVKLENNYLATIKVIINSAKKYQQMLKLVSARLMRNGMFAQSQLSTKCLLISKNSFLALEAAQLESNQKEILDKPKFRDIL